MLQTRTGKRTGTRRRADRRRDGQGRPDRRDDGRQARQPRQPEPPAHAAARPARRRSSRWRRGSPPAPARPRARSSSRPRPPSSMHESTPNEPILLVRKETSPEDVAGMHLAKGILTSTGGKASHAAVVARGWGKPCVVGCEAIRIDEKAGTDHHRRPDRQGGRLPDHQRHDRRRDDRQGADHRRRRSRGDFATLMGWADKFRTLKVRTNADTPADAAKAREFGAEGIGLCRTEHMFFGDQRIVAMRKMILADDEAGPQGRPRRARAVPAGRLRRHLRGDGRPARSPSACSTRRCTSSCRTTTRPGEVAKQLGITVEKVKRPRRAAPRVQPDARLPRLPLADRLSRDRRHAGRAPSSRRPSRSRRRASRSCPRS